jgi:hypothetical protein
LSLVAGSKFTPGLASCGHSSAPDTTTVPVTFNPAPQQ